MNVVDWYLTNYLSSKPFDKGLIFFLAFAFMLSLHPLLFLFKRQNKKYFSAPFMSHHAYEKDERYSKVFVKGKNMKYIKQIKSGFLFSMNKL